MCVYIDLSLVNDVYLFFSFKYSQDATEPIKVENKLQYRDAIFISSVRNYYTLLIYRFSITTSYTYLSFAYTEMVYLFLYYI